VFVPLLAGTVALGMITLSVILGTPVLEALGTIEGVLTTGADTDGSADADGNAEEFGVSEVAGALLAEAELEEADDEALEDELAEELGLGRSIGTPACAQSPVAALMAVC